MNKSFELYFSELINHLKKLKINNLLAKEHNITARQVEKRLFDYDKANQKGKLYKK